MADVADVALLCRNNIILNIILIIIKISVMFHAGHKCFPHHVLLLLQRCSIGTPLFRISVAEVSLIHGHVNKSKLNCAEAETHCGHCSQTHKCGFRDILNVASDRYQ